MSNLEVERRAAAGQYRPVSYYERFDGAEWPKEVFKKVNIDAARIKSIVCLTLTFPVWVTIILLRGKIDYDCTPNNVTGIFYGSLAEDECRFKMVNSIFSLIFLLPFLHESVVSTLVLAKISARSSLKHMLKQRRRSTSGSVNRAESVATKDSIDGGTYGKIVFVEGEVGTLASTDKMDGGEDLLDWFLSRGSLGALFYSIVFICLFPFITVGFITRTIISFREQKASCAEICDSFTEIFWFQFLLLPPIFLTVSLFPLSFYVVNTSESIAEAFVNLVAIQVFAQIDDILVRMLVHPRKSLGTILDGYCDGFIDEYRALEKLHSRARPKPNVGETDHNNDV